MKKIVTLLTLFSLLGVCHAQESEKRIKFNKGTLKICSTSHMTIKGYDGNEVIIKSLNNTNHFVFRNNFISKNKDSVRFYRSTDSATTKGYTFITNQLDEINLEKGLKPLGSKSTNPADNLYLDITQKSGELIIRDYQYKDSGQNSVIVASSFTSHSNKYELLVPNSVKLLWNTENCTKKNSNTFYFRTNSTPWELSDFTGEVEISTSYNSINLTNVTGPVIANTIGGNIKVVFENSAPSKLYSLVSNDGYIDVTLPENANLKVDATGYRILSDIDFKIITETITNASKSMQLQLNAGRTKMKLDAGSGSVYLRKRE
ncbi:hypothetical protein KORDIASMS9_00351 [Kordia sp. SMS9]|uniref:hypothetical protein n=1 Tax=Kordia sp. SMS9 TaxID=2282170 RepID=UPI000E0D46D4|nr:hypothetical protein [Kordia sp. SMS9]AXG68161.1 hypothetical protein KORDIASMS9_00351 [Kordia sp. SMS9]